MNLKSPTALSIKRLRSKVQKNYDLNINQARCWCAAAALTEPHLWLGWETSKYEMPVANFQLVQVKLMLIDRSLFSVSPDIPAYRHTIGLPVFWRQSPHVAEKMKRNPRTKEI